MNMFSSYGGYGYYTPPSSFRFFPKGMKALLIANVSVFLLQLFLQLGVRVGNLYLYDVFFKHFALFPLGDGFYIWQLVTYMFLHGGFFHILFNMLALWFFGVELESVWGTRRFVTYYFLCGIGGGLTNLFVTPLFTTPGPTIGASGAIYGVLLAFGMLFPDAPVFLYFLFPIKAKYFVAIFIAIELFYGVTGTESGVAHFAHLGGAFVGLIYLLYSRRSVRIIERSGDLISNFVSRVKNVFSYRKTYTDRTVITDAKYEDISDKNRNRASLDLQERIDKILDKISASGYDSLTDEEKEILFKASKKMN
ncbi:MAG: rhomboid family intramembrane serine protease [Candidatus Kryptoniota bacterium]